MAALSDYSYGDLQSEIYEEFGFGSERATFVQRRINRALHWLTRHRATWQFLLRPFTINVEPAVTGTVNVVQGSDSVSYTSGVDDGDAAARSIMVPNAQTGDITSTGYMVTAVGQPFTIDAEYVGASETSKTVTFAKCYYPLPGNCSMVKMLVDAADPRSRMCYMMPADFESKRLDQTMGIRDRYTVVPDPLGTDTENPYLALFPYPNERKTLRGLYFFTMDNMDTSSDISFIPRLHRPILVDASCWMIATAIGDPRQDEFKIRTALAMQEMAESGTFSNDDDPGDNDWKIFLEGDGPVGDDGPGMMPSFNW
jgi:hypothetical protein